jgi:hypothetical protein
MEGAKMGTETEPQIHVNDLDDIERRAEAAWGDNAPERLIHAELIGKDIPNLVAEVKRLRNRLGVEGE